MEYKKYILLSFIFSLFFITAEAQILKPAKWSTSVSEKTVAIGEEVDLIFLVDIQKDWYLYSTDFDPDLGPMVTEFNFEPNETYELVGGIQPIGAKEKYDDLWKGNYTYFTEKAEFRQTIRILKEGLIVRGGYEYQVCTDVDFKCIPFEDDFEFTGFTVQAPSEPNGLSAPQEKERVSQSVTEEIPLATVRSDSGSTIETISISDSSFTATKSETAGPDNTMVPLEKKKSSLTERAPDDPYSMLGFMVLAFLGGLAALLTPCVFPMIPMTVTFFTSTSKNRRRAITKAFVYGISILVIYVLAGTVVAIINGPEFANWLSTHWVPNVFFFLVFIFFAMAFLGMFELTLPSGLVNKVDAKGDKGGLTGIFFMAFTLVLVSFSCTGPIVGSILIASAGGEIIQPILGMFAFSLAFAIPFALFAIFPEWLNSLPKSGGWLNSVKVVLGFLELALAFKFLSIADQVYHWGLLDRDIYLAIWIVIFTLMGFYLLGKIRLPHDSPMESIGVPRLMLAITTFVFVVYMIPGLWGAPLKALSGYLPPMSSHDFDLGKMIWENQGGGTVTSLEETPKYGDFLHMPHGLQGYFDYQQALEVAKKADKPLFIDFTGHGCVNCREMEARVWIEPEVLKRFREDFVMVALYIDERYELPEEEWYTSQYDGKVKKTIGKQNADFQITRFNNNAQPYYVLLNTDETPLVPPKAYDLNVQNFIDFLDEGLANFKSK